MAHSSEKKILNLFYVRKKFYHQFNPLNTDTH